MSISLIATFKGKDDTYEKLKEAFKGALNETKNYEGCQYVGACSDDKDKAIILYEVWDSKDHQEKYIKWREDTGVLKTIAKMCRERPIFKFVDFLF